MDLSRCLCNCIGQTQNPNKSSRGSINPHPNPRSHLNSPCPISQSFPIPNFHCFSPLLFPSTGSTRGCLYLFGGIWNIFEYIWKIFVEDLGTLRDTTHSKSWENQANLRKPRYSDLVAFCSWDNNRKTSGEGLTGCFARIIPL